MQGWHNVCKSINVIHYIMRIKGTYHINRYIKLFDKIQLPLMIKIVKKLDIEGIYLNTLKVV